MAPVATTTANGHTNGHTNGHSNGTLESTSLKATAPAFHPAGTPDPSRYHASSTESAIHDEHTYAAHNYHPLPIVFARGAGCSVWDPEGISGLRLERQEARLTRILRQTLSRLSFCVRRHESRPLPSGTGQSSYRTGFSVNAELESILQ